LTKCIYGKDQRKQQCCRNEVPGHVIPPRE
jgi:hypothetical protein